MENKENLKWVSEECTTGLIVHPAGEAVHNRLEGNSAMCICNKRSFQTLNKGSIMFDISKTFPELADILGPLLNVFLL